MLTNSEEQTILLAIALSFLSHKTLGRINWNNFHFKLHLDLETPYFAFVEPNSKQENHIQQDKGQKTALQNIEASSKDII